MKINVSFTPDLVALMRAEVAAGQKAVSTTMAQAGASLKTAWRGQITGAGLGLRLANTIRLQTYPKGRDSLDAAALVWSNAPVIIGAHDTGPLIRSTSGFWLAIPLPAAGKALGGKRITPAMWEQKTGLRLRFVYQIRPKVIGFSDFPIVQVYSIRKLRLSVPLIVSVLLHGLRSSP